MVDNNSQIQILTSEPRHRSEILKYIKLSIVYGGRIKNFAQLSHRIFFHYKAYHNYKVCRILFQLNVQIWTADVTN